MESFLSEVAKQVPSLAVLCFVVWVFIRHLDKRSEALSKMHEEHLYAREESRLAIKENTLTTKETGIFINELKAVIIDKLKATEK